MDNPTLLTAIITLTIAFIGFIGTYINNVRLNQRQARLDRINRQLSEFYGPLLAIRGASSEIGSYFIKKYGFETGHFYLGKASKEDLEVWQLWMETVFMPGNRRMYELILSKADLLLDDDMPDVLLAFCAHVLGYEAVMKRWEEGDFSEYVSVIAFPRGLDDYIKHSFSLLKHEQARLLGRHSPRRSRTIS